MLLSTHDQFVWGRWHGACKLVEKVAHSPLRARCEGRLWQKEEQKSEWCQRPGSAPKRFHTCATVWHDNCMPAAPLPWA
jgi:hypothetical protein